MSAYVCLSSCVNSHQLFITKKTGHFFRLDEDTYLNSINNANKQEIFIFSHVQHYLFTGIMLHYVLQYNKLKWKESCDKTLILLSLCVHCKYTIDVDSFTYWKCTYIYIFCYHICMHIVLFLKWFCLKTSLLIRTISTIKCS